MKNILERSKKINILFLIMIGFLIYSLFGFFTNYDNDLWFILATGRSILNNGISHFDTLSMHSDYFVVTQQWLTSIIYYFTLNSFGPAVFSTMISIISILGIAVLYRYSKFLTNNTSITCLLVTFYIYFFVQGFTTTRPQIITYLILTLELFLTDKFIKSKNKKYLYFLPILSMLEINLHSSMWFLQFCFLGVYLIDCIKDKNLRRPLFITLIIMLLAGLINPFGIDAITYVFKSYGISIINDNIIEMSPITVQSLKGKIVLISLFLVILTSSLYKRINLRYLLLLGGTAYLGLSHLKSIPYFGIAFTITMSSLLTDVNLKEVYLNYINKIKFNKIKNIFIKVSDLSFKYLKLAFAVTTLMLIIDSYATVISEAQLDHPYDPMIRWLDNNEPNKDVKIYTNYGDGGYLEWRGYKPYIDPRGDVFLKSTNKKFDLMEEYVNAEKGIKTEEFINKYNFDYLILIESDKDEIYNYIHNNRKSDYKVVYRLFGPTHAVLYKKVK
ncbi:MAG: hypothetical protein IJS56_00145 [Bacilli bacterium]|nr:hypothetical protein [Bacilli bacterium]